MDFDTKEEPEVIVLDEEDCPFTIITVKIGENGTVEETNEPAFNLEPQIPATNYEQVDDSSETDNSDDWTDDTESPANVVSVQPKNKSKRNRNGAHRCPYCGKKFGQKLHLKDHVMTHTGEQPFKCAVCHKGFIQRSNLNRHILQRHPSEAPRLMMDKLTQSFNCWQCKSSFDTHYDYTNHMNAHKNASSSLQSGEASDVNLSSNSDAENDAAQITYSCAFCDQEYPDEQSLASHMYCHTAVQSPNSFICKDKPEKVHTERKEEEEESGEENSAYQNPESVTCKYCGKQCDTKIRLSYHERTHRIQRKFRCSVCTKGFNRRLAYEQHLQLHSANPDAQIKHQKVEKMSKYPTLKSPDATQQSPESFSCEYCGKQCSTEMTLSYHERSHRIQRMFRCSICRRGFDSKVTFDRHVKRHAKASEQKLEEIIEKYPPQQSSSLQSFSCLYCGKHFVSKLSLSYHEKSHTTQSTFCCSVCKRGFDNEQAYFLHIREHSDNPAVGQEHEKDEETWKNSPQQSPESFSCKYCGKECSTEITLSYHERTHRIKRRHICSICTKGFNSRLAYDRHVTKHSSKTLVQTEHQNVDESGDGASAQSQEYFSCKYCAKQYDTKMRLSYHERTHQIKRTFNCSVCAKGFKKRQAYEQHVRMHQEGGNGDVFPAVQSQKPFGCSECGERFDTKLSLADHEKTHQIQWTFHCNVCNKGFNRRQTYDRHVKLHSSKSNVQTEHVKEDETDEDSSQQSPESFSCKYCGKECDTKVSLSYHERTHRIKKTFYCSVCNRGFVKRQAYNQHLRQHSLKTDVPTEHQKGEESLQSLAGNLSTGDPLKPFSCDECGVRFRHKQWLDSHMKYHVSFSCTSCNKKFSSKAAYLVHVKSHTSEMPYSCSVCDEKFKLPGRLAQHMKTHGVDSFRCSDCDSSFTSRFNLNLHMAQFHKDRPFSCTDSGEKPSQRKDLSHQHTADKTERPFSCLICKKRFNRRAAYDRHLRVHSAKLADIQTEHQKGQSGVGYSAQQNPGRISKDQGLEEDIQPNSGESLFSCPFCDKELSTEQSLKEHMEDHEKNDSLKPFSCDKCEARFGEKKWLESHMEIHAADGTPALRCDICNKRFAAHSKYETHMKLHALKRPYSCTVCHKLFDRKSKLEVHARVHSGEKPFSCPVCSLKFSNNSNLNRHMQVHGGEEDVHKEQPGSLQKGSVDVTTDKAEMSLSCEDCGKRYSSKRSLISHKRCHNPSGGKKTFSCSVCNASFRTRLSYDWHVKTHRPKPERREGAEGEPRRPFRREVCGDAFSDDDGRERHRSAHQNTSASFSRSVCEEALDERETYEARLTNHEAAEETELENREDSGTVQMDSFGQTSSETLAPGLSV